MEMTGSLSLINDFLEMNAFMYEVAIFSSAKLYKMKMQLLRSALREQDIITFPGYHSVTTSVGS